MFCFLCSSSSFDGYNNCFRRQIRVTTISPTLFLIFYVSRFFFTLKSVRNANGARRHRDLGFVSLLGVLVRVPTLATIVFVDKFVRQQFLKVRFRISTLVFEFSAPKSIRNAGAARGNRFDSLLHVSARFSAFATFSVGETVRRRFDDDPRYSFRNHLRIFWRLQFLATKIGFETRTRRRRQHDTVTRGSCCVSWSCFDVYNNVLRRRIRFATTPLSFWYWNRFETRARREEAPRLVFVFRCSCSRFAVRARARVRVSMLFRRWPRFERSVRRTQTQTWKNTNVKEHKRVREHNTKRHRETSNCVSLFVLAFRVSLFVLALDCSFTIMFVSRRCVRRRQRLEQSANATPRDTATRAVFHVRVRAHVCVSTFTTMLFGDDGDDDDTVVASPRFER